MILALVIIPWTDNIFSVNFELFLLKETEQRNVCLIFGLLVKMIVPSRLPASCQKAETFIRSYRLKVKVSD